MVSSFILNLITNIILIAFVLALIGICGYYLMRFFKRTKAEWDKHDKEKEVPDEGGKE
ncbi:hypothetical protein LCGC14_1859170 [marine sediment metagenome]|uniref:Uncharacterized protein n=1 Tax=marine sediment metagenome TaxID=412755 RepID=A0A0F9J744_9ZZZZ